jgi:hypothetical protein
MTNVIYTVTEIQTETKTSFKSIKKAVQFIENWATKNNQHTGKIDIDKNTLLWNVGTFAAPIIQFEKTTLNN